MKEKTIEQLLERRSQIAAECEQENADLNALEQEVRNINEELEKRKAEAQKREEIRQQVAKQNNTIETNKGEKTMELVTRDSQVYKSAWLRKLMGRELTEDQQNAMVESRAFSSLNTYAVPTSIADEVVETLKQVAPLINEIDLYTAVGTIRIPYESVVQGASDIAAANEGTKSVTPASDATLYIDLAGFSIVKIVEVSKNALIQSEAAFEKWLVRNIARKIGDAIDRFIAYEIWCHNGEEEDFYAERFNKVICREGDDMYEGIAKTIGLLPAAYDNGAKWVICKKFLWEIKGVTDSNGRPIFDARDNTLLGFPVIVDDNIADGRAYFGNLFEAVKGVQSPELEIETNEYGSGWEKALVSFRGFTTFNVKNIADKNNKLIIQFTVIEP